VGKIGKAAQVLKAPGMAEYKIHLTKIISFSIHQKQTN
jgi:hypothetical protein